MPADSQVLVAGAGPVGLTAALLLRRGGADVRVIEAASDVDTRMRASTFHPPTLDMLDALGLADRLIEMGLKVPTWQLRQHDRGDFVRFHLSTISDITSHPYRLQVEQHRYCRLLIDALAAEGIEVAWNAALEALEQDDSGVHVTLRGGETMRCEWLVGADGANSGVRGALGAEYGGKTYTHSSVIVSTSFPFHEHLDDIDDVTYCWSHRGPFTLLRLRNFWRASLYPGVEDLNVAAEESRVRDWMAYIHPDAGDARIRDINPYRVHERCVDGFRQGRVVLAGDAAHLNPPSGGMGMNGGIHDAANLAEKLLQVIDGADDDLLDLYDRQRRHVASQRVIPQASANRARMAVTNADAQDRRMTRYKAIEHDPKEHRNFVRTASMISSLEEAKTIA